MSVVCRMCLHQIYDDSFVSVNDNSVVKDQLSQCIPEMIMTLVTNPIICTSCTTALDFVYNFKSRCLQMERRILNHLNGIAPAIDGTQLVDILYASLNREIKCEIGDSSELDMAQESCLTATYCSTDDMLTGGYARNENSSEINFEPIKHNAEELEFKPCQFVDAASIATMEDEADLCDTTEIFKNTNLPRFDEHPVSDSSIDSNKPWKNGLKGKHKDFSSRERFGNASFSVIDDIIQHSVPLNTKKSQVCIWNQFIKFCREKSYVLDKNTSVERISHILKDWGYNMKKSNGSDYKESVVKTMWNVTAKLIQEMYYKKYGVLFNPFNDILFKTARDARNAKRRQLKSYPEKRKASSVPLTPEEYNKIIRIWDEDTPFGLQRKFYHIATCELSWRRTEATNCMVYYFVDEVDNNGIPTGRVEYNPAFSRTGPGYQKVPGSKWLTPNIADPDACPVRLLRKLLSKRNGNIKTDRLFLTINPSWNSEKSIGWFKNSPVGINEISKWMKTAARKVGVDTSNIKITNPSMRPILPRFVNGNGEQPEFMKVMLFNYNFKQM